MKLSDMLEVPAEQFGQEGFWLFRNNFDFMLKHALIVNIIHGEEKRIWRFSLLQRLQKSILNGLISFIPLLYGRRYSLNKWTTYVPHLIDIR